MTASKRRDNEVAWVPDEATRSRAQLQRFIEFCGLGSYAELQRRSTEDVGRFTERLLEFLEIQFDRRWETVLDLSRGIEWPHWCVGGQLNITKSCLDRKR